jgi:secretion/DNA translocation related TadE-like protein
VLGLIGVVAVATVAALWLGAAVLAHTRAVAAADLAALAGAQALLDGLDPAAACAEAAQVIQAEGAQLIACRAVGDRCEVTVTRAVTRAGTGGRALVARARAVAGRPP